MSKQSSVMNRLRKTRSTLHLAGLLVAICFAMIAGIAFYEPVLAEAVQVRNVTRWQSQLIRQKSRPQSEPSPCQSAFL